MVKPYNKVATIEKVYPYFSVIPLSRGTQGVLVRSFPSPLTRGETGVCKSSIILFNSPNPCPFPCSLLYKTHGHSTSPTSIRTHRTVSNKPDLSCPMPETE